ncbi:MAG: nitroreductase family deazaflavin-dependent oxidoreductase [Mycobacteriaceae bacterium]|nr:nitroreductase family deazaflavin-dependent oxidoreductase [Mycobacteriaceae bacterium]
MAYLKPPWFTRKIFNPIAMATGIGNSETLTVIKRTSKEPQKIPVTPVDVDGVKYLVCPRGETQWVKNVRANPQVKLNDVGYLATEVPVQGRPPILDAYKVRAGKAVDGYFRQLPDPADHPTFTLTPQ